MMLPSNHRMFPTSLDIFRDDFFSNDMMKTDIVVQDDTYIVEMELPGLEKQDIQLDYQNGYVTVVANHEEVIEEEKEYIHKERYYGSYKRSFYVGEIDREQMKATYDKGILKITLPKKSEETEMKTQIKID